MKRRPIRCPHSHVKISEQRSAGRKRSALRHRGRKPHARLPLPAEHLRQLQASRDPGLLSQENTPGSEAHAGSTFPGGSWDSRDQALPVTLCDHLLHVASSVRSSC